MTESNDDLDRSLTERLRAYESRIPGDAAPDLDALGRGARRPSARVWGTLAAAGGVVVGLVLALSLGSLVPPPTGEASATPQPKSPAATPLATPAAPAAPSLTLAPVAGLSSGDQLLAIAQVDGRLIAVGSTWESEGGVWTSPDGASWALVPNLPTTQPGDYAGTTMESIVDGPAGLVAAGSYHAIDFSSPRIWYSADGEQWTSVYGPSDPARGAFGRIAALAVGGPGYVAVGHTSDDGFTARPQIWSSADGREWVVVDGQLPTGRGLYDVIEGGGVLVAVGDGGAVVSADGATWTAAPEQEALLGANMTSVAFRNGVFVASGLISGSGEPTPAIWSSPDGLDWTLVERGVSGQLFGQVVSTDAGFVAIGGDFPSHGWQYDPAAPNPPQDTVQLWFSADGEAWTGPTTGFAAEGGITLGRGAVSGGDILVPVTVLVPEGPAPSPAILYGPSPTR